MLMKYIKGTTVMNIYFILFAICFIHIKLSSELTTNITYYLYFDLVSHNLIIKKKKNK